MSRWREAAKRLFGTLSAGAVCGLGFFVLHYATEAMHPFDVWFYVQQWTMIGTIVGGMVGIVWALLGLVWSVFKQVRHRRA